MVENETIFVEKPLLILVIDTKLYQFALIYYSIMTETNKNNFSFYKNIGVSNLKNLQEIGGFSSCNDMKIIWPFIKDASHILELGAGTGRCVEFLIENNFAGQITAIEQSEAFIEHLEKTYSKQATIISGDFKTYPFKDKFNAVLWMWSGILDFSEKEQFEAFEKVKAITTPDAVLTIDTPLIGFKTFAEHEDSQHLHLDSEYGSLDCFIPTPEDIKKLAEANGFSIIHQEDYSTSTDKKRTLFVLQQS